MTTFQDPQPQSRRAVRQGERGDSGEQGFAEQGFAPQPGFTGQAPQFYADPQAARDMWDTTARRAAQLPPAAARPDAAARQDAAATGRRAAAGQPAPAAEPLNYSTQQTQNQQAQNQQTQNPQTQNQQTPGQQAPGQLSPHDLGQPIPGQQAPGQPGTQTPIQQAPGQQSGPQAPGSDAPSLRSRARAVADAAPQPPTQALPHAEQPVYRVRDFSPEGRRAASPDPQPSWSVQAPPSDLDYRTELRADYGSAQQAPVAQVAPTMAPAPVSQVPPAVAPAPQPIAPQPVAPISELPVEQTLSRRELRALQQAESASDLQYPTGAQPTPAQSVPVLPGQSAPVQPAPVQPAPGHYAQAPAAPAAPFATGYSTPPEPVTTTALTNAITEFDTLARGQQSAPVDTPSSWTPPVGHWSTQADLDDGVPETTINRRVGSGSTATNALVLPAIPAGADIRGPLTGTGEIMLTGSIDLPRSLSSTGASARLEHGGIDDLFEMHDAEAVSTDSSPVRAIKAVSTHTSGHGVTHTQKPKGTRALTALLIAASSMAVVVAGLLVAAFAFNVF